MNTFKITVIRLAIMMAFVSNAYCVILVPPQTFVSDSVDEPDDSTDVSLYMTHTISSKERGNAVT